MAGIRKNVSFRLKEKLTTIKKSTKVKEREKNENSERKKNKNHKIINILRLLHF